MPAGRAVGSSAMGVRRGLDGLLAISRMSGPAGGQRTRAGFRGAEASLIGLAIAFFTLLGAQNATRPLTAYALVLVIPLVLVLTGVTRRAWIAAGFLLFLGIAIRWAYYDPNYLGSDVLPLINEAIEVLLGGHNPYAHQFIISNNELAYPPGYLLIYLPGYAFGEIRLTEIFSAGLVLAGFAYVSYLIRDDWPVAAMGLYATAPPLVELTVDGSSDTTLGALLFLSVILMLVARRNDSGALLLLSGALMGSVIAFKPYSIPFWPMLIAYLFSQSWHASIQLRGRSRSAPSWLAYGATTAAIGALIVLPFFFWSPHDFVHDVFLWSSKSQIEGWNVWAFLLRWQGWNAQTLGDGLIVIDLGVMVLAIVLGLAAGVTRPSRALLFGASAWFLVMLFARWTTYAYFAGVAPVVLLIPFADRLAEIPEVQVAEKGRGAAEISPPTTVLRRE